MTWHRRTYLAVLFGVVLVIIALCGIRDWLRRATGLQPWVKTGSSVPFTPCQEGIPCFGESFDVVAEVDLGEVPQPHHT